MIGSKPTSLPARWVGRSRPALGVLVAAIGSLLSPASEASFVTEEAKVILVSGAVGAPEFAEFFAGVAERWEAGCERSDTRVIALGRAPLDEGGDARSDRDRLREILAEEPKTGSHPLWLVLAGHGTFDGRDAKFNLRGEDVSAVELASWLKDFERPLVLINTASSSGPFLRRLSAPGRVVITATQSGREENFAWFGKFLAESVADPGADLDKDGQTSLLEAYLVASRRTRDHYEADGRIVTEHALLDDNGDGLGTRAEAYQGLLLVRRPKGETVVAADGPRAHQFHLVPSAEERALPAELRARRNALELEMHRLRDRRESLGDDVYYRLLEDVLLQIAEIYSQAEAGAAPGSPPEPGPPPGAPKPEAPKPAPEPAQAATGAPVPAPGARQPAVPTQDLPEAPQPAPGPAQPAPGPAQPAPEASVSAPVAAPD